MTTVPATTHLVDDLTVLAARIQRIEDIQAVTELKHRYARLCDTGFDPDAITALFAPAEPVTWRSNLFGVHHGHDAIRVFFSGVGAQIHWAAHHMLNPTVRIHDDGTTATGTWQLLELAVMPPTDYAAPAVPASVDSVVMTGYYRDTFTKLDGRWFFTEIDIEFDKVSNLDQGWARQPRR